jgi:flagellar hook assembly protein FlgD
VTPSLTQQLTITTQVTQLTVMTQVEDQANATRQLTSLANVMTPSSSVQPSGLDQDKPTEAESIQSVKRLHLEKATKSMY